MLAELCAATSINSSHTQACCLELQTACKHSADLRSLEPIREGNGFPAPADSRVSHWQSLLLHPCPAIWPYIPSDQCRKLTRRLCFADLLPTSKDTMEMTSWTTCFGIPVLMRSLVFFQFKLCFRWMFAASLVADVLLQTGLIHQLPAVGGTKVFKSWQACLARKACGPVC